MVDGPRSRTRDALDASAAVRSTATMIAVQGESRLREESLRGPAVDDAAAVRSTTTAQLRLCCRRRGLREESLRGPAVDDAAAVRSTTRGSAVDGSVAAVRSTAGRVGS